MRSVEDSIGTRKGPKEAEEEADAEEEREGEKEVEASGSFERAIKPKRFFVVVGVVGVSGIGIVNWCCSCLLLFAPLPTENATGEAEAAERLLIATRPGIIVKKKEERGKNTTQTKKGEEKNVVMKMFYRKKKSTGEKKFISATEPPRAPRAPCCSRGRSISWACGRWRLLRPQKKKKK